MVRDYNYKIIMDSKYYYVKISNLWLTQDGSLSANLTYAKNFNTLSSAEDGVYNYMIRQKI